MDWFFHNVEWPDVVPGDENTP